MNKLNKAQIEKHNGIMRQIATNNENRVDEFIGGKEDLPNVDPEILFLHAGNDSMDEIPAELFFQGAFNG